MNDHTGRCRMVCIAAVGIARRTLSKAQVRPPTEIFQAQPCHRPSQRCPRLVSSCGCCCGLLRCLLGNQYSWPIWDCLVGYNSRLQGSNMVPTRHHWGEGVASVWARSFGSDSMWYWSIYSCISYSPSFSSSTRINADYPLIQYFQFHQKASNLKQYLSICVNRDTDALTKLLLNLQTDLISLHHLSSLDSTTQYGHSRAGTIQPAR